MPNARTYGYSESKNDSSAIVWENVNQSPGEPLYIVAHPDPVSGWWEVEVRMSPGRAVTYADRLEGPQDASPQMNMAAEDYAPGGRYNKQDRQQRDNGGFDFGL